MAFLLLICTVEYLHYRYAYFKVISHSLAAVLYLLDSKGLSVTAELELYCQVISVGLLFAGISYSALAVLALGLPT